MKDNTYYGSNDGTSYCLFENPVLRTGVQKETTALQEAVYFLKKV